MKTVKEVATKSAVRPPVSVERKTRKSKDSMKLYIRSDPEHSWLTVPRKLISKFGLTTKISTHSFQRKTNVYLDKEKDMPTFVKEAQKHGLTLDIVDLHTERSSKILKYNTYTPRNRDLYQ